MVGGGVQKNAAGTSSRRGWTRVKAGTPFGEIIRGEDDERGKKSFDI